MLHRSALGTHQLMVRRKGKRHIAWLTHRFRFLTSREWVSDFGRDRSGKVD
jgi:hypothetical protein